MTQLVLSLSTAAAMAATMSDCSAVPSVLAPGAVPGTFLVGVVNIGSDSFFFRPATGGSVELLQGETFHVQETGNDGDSFTFQYLDAVGNEFTATCKLENGGEQLFVPREVDINLNTGQSHCIEWQ